VAGGGGGVSAHPVAEGRLFDPPGQRLLEDRVASRTEPTAVDDLDAGELRAAGPSEGVAHHAPGFELVEAVKVQGQIGGDLAAPEAGEVGGIALGRQAGDAGADAFDAEGQPLGGRSGPLRLRPPALAWNHPPWASEGLDVAHRPLEELFRGRFLAALVPSPASLSTHWSGRTGGLFGEGSRTRFTASMRSP